MTKVLFPNEIVLDTKYFTIAQDWEVPIPAFFIVSVKRKIRSVADFNDDELHEFITIVRKVRQGMRDLLNIRDVYLFHNEDSEHGFHLWIFPRHEWMEKFGRKIQSVRPIMEYAKINMVNENIFQEVRDMVYKMRTYM